MRKTASEGHFAIQGCACGEIRNPKSETRMTNQIRNPKSESTMIRRGPFRISGFGFDSSFEFRISSFRASLIALLLLLAASGVASAQAIAPGAGRERDLLAEAGVDHFWIAGGAGPGG